MKKQKIIILTSFLLLQSFLTFGQDSSIIENKTKEFYFSLADISPINVTIKYKQQIKNKTFLKLGLINLSSEFENNRTNNPSSYPTKNYFYSAGVEIGIEFRKPLSKICTIFHGPNIDLTYRSNIYKTENPTLQANQKTRRSNTYIGGIPYTVGFLFQIKNHFLVSAEINPSVNLTHIEYTDSYNSQFDYESFSSSISMGNTSGLISLIYRM